MTMLLSLPEELLGLIYSHLPKYDSGRRAFSSCATVRTAPSVLSQITTQSLRTTRLKQCPRANPIAGLPRGVHLKSLLVTSTEEDTLHELFCPEHEGTRNRVQDVLSSLEELELYLTEQKKDSRLAPDHLSTLGCCLGHLPTTKKLHLILEGWEPGDVVLLLESMARCPLVQGLKDFELWTSTLNDSKEDHSALVCALAAFKGLQVIRSNSVYKSISFLPLTTLPELHVLDVVDECTMDQYSESLKDVFALSPFFPVLTVLHAFSLPDGGPPLCSTQLEQLHLRVLEDHEGLISLAGVLRAAVASTPRLRQISVEELELNIESEACGVGVMLKESLALVPHLSLTVESLRFQSYDVLYTLCSEVPVLGHSAESLDLGWTRTRPGRLDSLARICPRLRSITVDSCSLGEIEVLRRAVKPRPMVLFDDVTREGSRASLRLRTC